MATELLDDVTAVLLTHEHPDHFDRRARSWVRQRALPLWSNRIDTPHLRASGLQAQALEDGALGMRVEVVPSRHGRGVLGWLMGPVVGYYLAHPVEPSIYLTGDSILTQTVLDAIERLKPDIVVAPAGAANIGLGGDILFSVNELMTLAHRAPGRVVLNHLEALDHCPTSRDELRARVRAEGLEHRVYVPNDGETLSFERNESRIPLCQGRGVVRFEPRYGEGGEPRASHVALDNPKLTSSPTSERSHRLDIRVMPTFSSTRIDAWLRTWTEDSIRMRIGTRSKAKSMTVRSASVIKPLFHRRRASA